MLKCCLRSKRSLVRIQSGVPDLSFSSNHIATVRFSRTVQRPFAFGPFRVDSDLQLTAPCPYSQTLTALEPKASSHGARPHHSRRSGVVRDAFQRPLTGVVSLDTLQISYSPTCKQSLQVHPAPSGVAEVAR
jgi:hypothetical protein